MNILKQLLRSLAVILLLFSAQTIFAESIEKYDIDIELQQDASLHITETINYDFGTNQKRGIFRIIPTTFEIADEPGERQLDISVQSITRDGQSEQELITNENKSFEVRIGNPDVTISGLHTYEIKYVVEGSIRYFDDFDEIYWNAIGHQWEIPINNIQVTIRNDMFPFAQGACYAGVKNSTNPCSSQDQNSTSVLFSQDRLDSGEGLTVAAGFGKGQIAVVENLYSQNILEKLLNFLREFLFPIGIFVVVGVQFALLYLYQNKYRTKKAIVTQYEPPQDLNPMLAGYAEDLKFDPRDITAGIIYLAQQGYIHIEHVPAKNWLASGDYIFTMKKNILELKKDLNKDEFFILTLLFEPNDIFRGLAFRTQGSESAGFANSQSLDAGKSGQFEVSEQFLNTRRLSEIKKARGSHVFEKASVVEFFKAELSSKGFVESGRVMMAKATRYTPTGWDLRYYLNGFKIFLSMTEKERYEFFNNPTDMQGTFMEYLPYAIAFGVEKKWAKQFKDIVMEQPDWYTGSDVGSVALASSLNNFSSAMTSSVTPKNSGSGSSGGGSSGGGGGGGGGGSW